PREGALVRSCFLRIGFGGAVWHPQGADRDRSVAMTAEHEKIIDIEAPTDGTVVALPIEIDEVVAAETTLLVLEVMKMEHPVRAVTDMRITEVLVSEGESVERGRTVV